MRNEALLLHIPADVKVVDCMDCGRLATFDWQAWRAFRAIGLVLAAAWRPLRSGHRRPVCRLCKRETPRDRLPHPTSWDRS